MNDLRAPFRELKRRVMNVIARAVLEAVRDTNGVQMLQVSLLADEVKGSVERLQNYGFTSHPLPGAEVFMSFIGGNRDHGLALVVEDRRYRLKGLKAGEVAIYDDQGQKIVLHRDRIEVTAPKVVVTSPDVHLGAEGGARVARIGDRVNVGAGSSAGLWPIEEGSSTVRAAG